MNEANRRYIKDYGHAVTLTTYTEGEADAYEDKALTSTDTTIKAIRKLFRGDVERSAGGASPVGDAVFWMMDTVSISDGQSTPASKITDGSMKFTVILVDNQDNGILAVTCQRMAA